MFDLACMAYKIQIPQKIHNDQIGTQNNYRFFTFVIIFESTGILVNKADFGKLSVGHEKLAPWGAFTNLD